MGGMPFHLEKGCMGLRFDYLCRSPLVRQYLLEQLLGSGNPLDIAKNITVAGITINALDDSKASFKTKLDQLVAALPTGRFDDEERRSSLEYEEDQTHLLPLNKDTSGNRAAFVLYWKNKSEKCPSVLPAMKSAMIQALQAATPALPALPALPATPDLPRPRIDFWWDCTLKDGDCPTVQCSLVSPRVARVLFITDHESAVAPRPEWVNPRATLD